VVAYRHHRTPTAADPPPKSSRAWLLLVVLAINAVFMPRIGFIPASAALFTAAAWLLGSRRTVRDVVIGLVVASALFLAFTRGLGLALPVDPVTGLLR
jgi:putative tricarboxylic transport membrane protein